MQSSALSQSKASTAANPTRLYFQIKRQQLYVQSAFGVAQVTAPSASTFRLEPHQTSVLRLIHQNLGKILV